MGKNILITGGAGFIGSNLTQSLVEKGNKITILDNLSPQIHGKYPEKDSVLYQSIKDQAVFIKGDVRNPEDWKKAIIDQEVIIHLAAETGTGQSMYLIQRYTEVNIVGTAIILDILTNNKHSVDKVIIASSRSIYGEGKYLDHSGNPVYPKARDEKHMSKGIFDPLSPKGESLKVTATDELSQIRPTSVYGITKQNQEQMVMTVCQAIGINAVALRFQNVYGPGQSLSNPYTGILSIFSTQIRNGNVIQIFEDGKESRDFVYIQDVVDATILCTEMDEANNKIFNVGSGNPVSVINIADKLIKAYNSNTKFKITGKFRLGDIRHNYADLRYITSTLGYEPKVSIDEGIQNFTRWVSSQKIQKDLHEISMQEMKKKGLLK